MSLWFAKDYLKKALNRWDLEGREWVQSAIDELDKTDKPRNLTIIKEIEAKISEVNEMLHNLHINIKEPSYSVAMTAIEEIDLFQKTTLFELRKVYE